ncbi:MAG: HPr family phosphocarrier protein [Alphaproteobacteria bacterium]|nr:HPr family phosphocarrier protein [Alphaproteobacteria bacterium]
MASAAARICNKKGLHARAAAKLVKLASGFDAQVEVVRLPRGGESEEARARATSILSLLMLAAEKGVDIELHAKGAQAQEALDAIVALVGRKFDEDE